MCCASHPMGSWSPVSTSRAGNPSTRHLPTYPSSKKNTYLTGHMLHQRTRDALQKSVQLAIEISTNAAEAEARQKATQQDQRASAEVERHRLRAEVEAEALRKDLEVLRAETASIQINGSPCCMSFNHLQQKTPIFPQFFELILLNVRRRAGQGRGRGSSSREPD